MYTVKLDKTSHQTEITAEGLQVDGTLLQWDITKSGEHHYHVLWNGKSFNFELLNLDMEAKTLRLKLNGEVAEVSVKDKFDLLLEKLGMGAGADAQMKEIKAPMPGLIFDIKVQVGDEVQKGDPVLILEAMKMENVLKSPGAGKVKAILIKKGQSVEKNQVLLQF
ncbi:biotin/lipoyl attachment domain-containing protein [Nitritalea halalkaliphila LW7]|uniref:Biotin/lipoyl attachment domain-containing protein n=1 Tax=Nitritalea halalkaliphila LW7 TaxID=1189621 RepID=I5C9V9_9BACT|nr:acetyl-CoA carboxylase biotin carboxyl carrier protein subunit [Nitritalea halalkaliphila]EIM78611.1 biotin/lipoyl attachment domain-containing protein [Nitritalea halalkaliphila LW7]